MVQIILLATFVDSVALAAICCTLHSSLRVTFTVINNNNNNNVCLKIIMSDTNYQLIKYESHIIHQMFASCCNFSLN